MSITRYFSICVDHIKLQLIFSFEKKLLTQKILSLIENYAFFMFSLARMLPEKNIVFMPLEQYESIYIDRLSGSLIKLN